MLLLLLHFICWIASGLLLWRLVALTRGMGRVAGAVVTAGFLCRAFLGAIAFWVSYLRLPIARTLQIGDGLWFFGLDAREYFDLSNSLIASGWKAFFLVDNRLPSPVYLQLLGVFIVLLGSSVAVGILINLFSYLGMAWIICRWGRSGDDISMPALVGLLALTFSPAALIWSTQPLKDPFFNFMIVVFIAACALWQRAWRLDGARSRTRNSIAAFLLLAIALYTVASIRWYFGVVLWGASFAFFVLTSLTSSSRRWVAVAVNVAAFVLLSQSVVLGGGPYLPNALGRLLRFRGPAQAVAALPHQVDQLAQTTRKGFENTPAATSISLGARLSHRTRPLVASSSGQTAPKSTNVVDLAQPDEAVPKSTFDRLLVGYVVLFVPHTIAESLQLVHVGGGRRLWAVADVDTLICDAMLIFALFVIVRTRAFNTPVLWELVLTALVISAALAYTINNFGTLMRHREMIYVPLCLVSVALAPCWRSNPASENTEGVSAPAVPSA